MSYYNNNNEYIIATNNSMNENKYNSDKMQNSGFKALLRPLMKIIKRTTKRVPAKSDTCLEEDQNDSNEALERKIYAEMECCQSGAAFLVYNKHEECDLVPVNRDDFYVPVHFARTDAGTFFWTTVNKPDADFAAAHCYTECQTAEQQYPIQDRWVQA